MSDAVRLAVVGTGRMGRNHLAVLGECPSVRLSAVVDPVAEAREAAAPGVAGYDRLADVIDAGVADAVLIAAPSGLHLGLVEEAASAGLAILCEKPCGLTPDDTRRAAEVASGHGVVLQVGYWRRFVPELQRLQEAIAAGELGEIQLVQAWQWDGEPPAAAFRASSGGILRDMGVHEFDQIRWLTGQDLSIVAALPSAVTSVPPVPGDPESIAVLARLGGGGVAIASLGRRYDHGDACWAEVIGTLRSERLPFMYGPDADDVFRKALAAQIEAFAAAVRGEPQRGATAVDAVEALAAADSAAGLAHDHSGA